MRIDQFTWLDASTSFGLFAVGCLLVTLEFARPGLILPGAAGGVLILVTVARLAHMSVTAAGVALLLAALTTLLIEIRYRWNPVPGLLPALLLFLAATRWSAVVHERVRPWLALPVSLVLCSLVVILGSAAWRGFWAKRNW